jgi:hypothetical protein
MKIGRRTELVNSETLLDELWVGVKCLTNLEIAGSPRNSFRTSLGLISVGGRALIGFSGLLDYEILSNSECQLLYPKSQCMGAKLHVREGNIPDHQLRSQNHVLSGKGGKDSLTSRRLA